MTTPEGVGAAMAQSGDPAYLGEGEARLVRLSCPDCDGAMAQVDLEQISYFTCHVGHRYSPQRLAAAQAEAAEARLWSAVAALEEHAAVLGYLAREEGPTRSDPERERWAESVAERARQLRHQAHTWASTPAVLEG